jgi:hypothetical protein
VSATVAHELNNIGAALFGFVELAAEGTSGAPLESSLLVELRVGVSRITQLALVLEALAETEAKLASVALAACVKLHHPLRASDDPDILWRCDRATGVRADPGHVQRFLQLLTSLAPPPAGAGVRLAVELGAMSADDRCCSCGAPLPNSAVRIAMLPGQIPDSPRKRRTVTSLRRLSLAACVHVAHLAGAHLLQTGAAPLPTLILPLAELESGGTSHSIE